MRDIALLAFFGVMLLCVFKKPFWGILLWCWVSYMVPHKLTWGFMLHFPIAQLVAITFMCSFLVSKEKKTNRLRSPIIWLLIFDCWLLLTFLVHPMTDHAINQITSFSKIQLFTFLTYIMVTNRDRLHQLLLVIALSITYFGAKGGISTVLTAGNTRIWGPPGGFFEGNNELGLTLLIVMPILYYFSTVVDKKWLKLALLGVILLSIGSVLGTQSRGALVAIVCCGTFFWLKSNSKVITLIALLIIAPIGFNFMPERWHDRMASIVQSDSTQYDGSVQGRFNAWTMSYNLANNNVMGGGFDSYTPTNFYLYAPVPEDLHDAHSIYFKILGQHGYIGLALFLIVWLSAWMMASKIHRQCKDDEELKWASLMARMLQISLIAYGSGGAFLGLAYFDLPYHIAICIVALYNIVEREKAQKLAQSDNEPIEEKEVNLLQNTRQGTLVAK